MSQLSVLQLRNLAAGAGRAQQTREGMQRIMTFCLPGSVRAQFYPRAEIRGEGRAISEGPDFVEWGAVHLLFLRLAQHPKLDGDIRRRINSQKAEAFFPACVQRDPPPKSQTDPVVQYGWDRVRDRELIKRMQDQCAKVFLGCDRAAYVETTPEIQPYLRDDPAGWYTRLASHLKSPLYARHFAATMKSGVQPLRDMLSNLFTKLMVLHEAAHGGTDPKPADVMADLCQNVGIPALEELDLPADAKDEIRNLLESVQAMARNPETAVDMQFNMCGLSDIVDGHDFIAVFKTATDEMDVLNGLAGFLAGITGASWIPGVRERLMANEIAKMVKRVGEQLGRRYDLWS